MPAGRLDLPRREPLSHFDGGLLIRVMGGKDDHAPWIVAGNGRLLNQLKRDKNVDAFLCRMPIAVVFERAVANLRSWVTGPLRLLGEATRIALWLAPVGRLAPEADHCGQAGWLEQPALALGCQAPKEVPSLEELAGEAERMDKA
ncbi:MAG: hypothetical protein QM582_03035 [Micropruina sp.]|uniref:hypothetical protein n=1 Tax=Micropruina sp. TaxID=2737536 RepID=UPI0039E62FF0